MPSSDRANSIDTEDAEELASDNASPKNPFENWGARLGSGMGKRIPKIKVCHKSNEFAVLTAMMNKLNS